MAKHQRIKLSVNGIEYGREVETRKLLSDFLREDLELTGTHVGCEHGVCGACTVLFNGKSVRSCLMFAVQADGAEITTIEGLANGKQMHQIQESFRDNHGLQCGFCTSGMLTTAHELLTENSAPSTEEAKKTMSGVLCRCTGYKQVIDSVMDAAEKMRAK